MKFKTIAVITGLVVWGAAVESHSLQSTSLAKLDAPISSAAAASISDETTLPANIFVNLAKKAVPSVVNISTVSTLKRTAFFPGSHSPNEGTPEDLFRGFFGPGFGGQFPGARPQKQAALGTGFVIDPSGIILTNNHVVANADEIKIQFTENGESVPGHVIGRDQELDVALIKVDTKKHLIALPLGDSDALEVGEYVMAVGNPYGQGHSVSHGIVSAKGRTAPGLPIANYLQIDAPINPGNSGGPLLNLKGEVVGINNAIDPRAQGIGFAIPINFVKTVLVDLKNGKHVRRGFIGAIVGETNTDLASKIGAPADLQAPFVTGVTKGSPAEKAGLKPYDAILSFNGKEVHTPNELVQDVTQVPVGSSVPMEVLRDGSKKTLNVKIKERPDSDVASNDSEESQQQPEQPARAGIALQKNPQGPGVVVSEVMEGSPAAEAGIRPGDVILEIDRKPANDVAEAKKLLGRDKSYLVRVERNDSYAIVVLDLKDSNKDNS
jgi:serine protease Do